MTPPRPIVLERNKEDQVSEEIKILCAYQAVKEVQHTAGQFLRQLFLVPKKDGSQRPVINLKLLNYFIQKQDGGSKIDQVSTSEKQLDDLN